MPVYHVLNFDNLNEKGLKPLMAAIKTAGGDVVKLEPAGTARKKDGIATKTFSLINVDGQTISIQVNETGDVSGATLNGSNYPALSPTSLNDMAQRIVQAFSGNAAKYANSLARKMARAAAQDNDKAAKKGVKSNVQRLAENRAQVSSYRANIQTLNDSLTAQQDRLNNATTTKNNATTDINAEKAVQDQLKKEISRLEAQINELI